MVNKIPFVHGYRANTYLLCSTGLYIAGVLTQSRFESFLLWLVSGICFFCYINRLGYEEQESNWILGRLDDISNALQKIAKSGKYEGKIMFINKKRQNVR